MNQLSLLELQSLIKQSIEDRLDLSYWVTAEINELKVNSSGHCYMELVQKSEKKNSIEAKVSAVIWSNMFRLLTSYFESGTGRDLEAGIKVLVKVHVQYHELYGLSLNITDIDPTYTVGSIELERQKTILQLQTDGIFEMNKELETPILPQHVAIISSQQAAGYQDFMQHLTQNEYGYAFKTQLFNATMQGREAAQSIIKALDSINNQLNEFDTVVLIRGGGSQADLACFDNYELAYNIAQFPLPILTGIGHDKDISICDMVAHQMLKTPTAVAAYLIDQLIEQDSILNEFAEQLHTVVNNADNAQQHYLLSCSMRLQGIIQSLLAKEQQKISSWYPKQLKSAVQYFIREQQQKIKQLESEVELRNPAIILKRGYSLTLHKGKIISSTSTLNENDLVDVILQKGRFTAEIKKIMK